MSQICANDLKNVAGTDVEDIEAFSGCKDEIVKVAHKLADAARVITLKYFRSKLFQIIDKADQSKFSPPHSNACQLNGEEFLTWVSLCRSLLNSFVAWIVWDSGPVTIADREAEETMRALLAEHFPSHAM